MKVTRTGESYIVVLCCVMLNVNDEEVLMCVMYKSRQESSASKVSRVCSFASLKHAQTKKEA